MFLFLARNHTNHRKRFSTAQCLEGLQSSKSPLHFPLHTLWAIGRNHSCMPLLDYPSNRVPDDILMRRVLVMCLFTASSKSPPSTASCFMQDIRATASISCSV